LAVEKGDIWAVELEFYSVASWVASTGIVEVEVMAELTGTLKVVRKDCNQAERREIL
jgi:hypothetical protein